MNFNRLKLTELAYFIRKLLHVVMFKCNRKTNGIKVLSNFVNLLQANGSSSNVTFDAFINNNNSNKETASLQYWE